MSNNVNKAEFSCIDIMKFFMAICVIAIHTRPFVEIDNDIFQALYEVIVRVAVPYFFMSSGYLLFKKLDYPYNDKKSIEKIKTNIVKTAKMYGIWTLVYMPITIYDYCTNGQSLYYNLEHFFQGLFFIGEHLNSWPLWYLLSAFYGLLIIYWLMKRKTNPSHVFVISFLIYIFGDLVDILIANMDLMPEWVCIFLRVYIKTFLKGRITQGVFFISCGMMLSDLEIKLAKKHYILLVIGCVVYAFCPIDFFKPLGLAIYSCIFFVLGLNVGEGKIYKYGIYCRSASKVMYYTHMIFYTVYVMITYHEKEYYGIDVFLVTLLLSLVASVIYINYTIRIARR